MQAVPHLLPIGAYLLKQTFPRSQKLMIGPPSPPLEGGPTCPGWLLFAAVVGVVCDGLGTVRDAGASELGIVVVIAARRVAAPGI